MKYDPKITEQKMRNVEVFRETIKICRDGRYTLPSGKVIRLPDTEDVISASAFHNEVKNAFDAPMMAESRVDLLKMDCIDAAQELVLQGYNPVMLNMASRRCPGGGVLNGARAQEETLFRRSNLCVSLYQYDVYSANILPVPLGSGHYPLGYDMPGIYSGRVMFFRKGVKDNYALMEEPFECAVVSAAAISHPELTPSGELVDWAAAATIEKIRNVLRIALLHGHDSVVLGAWGCGAFKNPPKHIAKLFKSALAEVEFAKKFRLVCFAIIEDHNSRHANFAAFSEVFNNAAGKVIDNVEAVRICENNEIIDHINAINAIEPNAGALSGALSGALAEKILLAVVGTPGINRKLLAVKVGSSLRNVDRVIACMVDRNLIERRGGKKLGGYYAIKKDEVSA